MSPVSYQTIKLSKGKHTVPEDGACVMELASALALIDAARHFRSRRASVSARGGGGADPRARPDYLSRGTGQDEQFQSDPRR